MQDAAIRKKLKLETLPEPFALRSPALKLAWQTGHFVSARSVTLDAREVRFNLWQFLAWRKSWLDPQHLGGPD